MRLRIERDVSVELAGETKMVKVELWVAWNALPVNIRWPLVHLKFASLPEAIDCFVNDTIFINIHPKIFRAVRECLYKMSEMRIVAMIQPKNYCPPEIFPKFEVAEILEGADTTTPYYGNRFSFAEIADAQIYINTMRAAGFRRAMRLIRWDTEDRGDILYNVPEE